MKILSRSEVHAKKVAELGLDPGAFDLASQEALGAALRRTAGFLCPCSARTLISTVVESLEGLIEGGDPVRTRVEETLEALVSYGDLLESCEGAGGAGRVALFLAPPSFVLRDSGLALLLGAAPDHPSVLPRDLNERTEYRGHVRYLRRRNASENLRQELDGLGLLELSIASWLRAPEAVSQNQHKSRIDALLAALGPSGEIPGLSILDPSQPVMYYRNRWVRPDSRSGRFVARREQTYGADLWCYVELSSGVPNRLLDFPQLGSPYRGCDEAWRLQIAIDALNGNRQIFRIEPAPENAKLFRLFSPVPIWARRRWDAIGELVPASGCLFAYRIPEPEVSEETRFLVDELWLRDATVGSD